MRNIQNPFLVEGESLLQGFAGFFLFLFFLISGPWVSISPAMSRSWLPFPLFKIFPTFSPTTIPLQNEPDAEYGGGKALG